MLGCSGPLGMNSLATGEVVRAEINLIPADMRKLEFSHRDEFQRKGIADKIINLLGSSVELSPILLNGEWGSGKTEFVCKLINLARERNFGHRFVYIDAFKADHADNPLLTVIANISAVASPKDDEGARPLRDGIIKGVKGMFKVGVNAGAQWMLKQSIDEVSNEFSSDVAKTTIDRAGKNLESRIDTMLVDHSSIEANINALKMEIKKATEHIPLVIVIDELDRCRPDFALSMLETIKHILDVESIQVILVTNIKQLQASISHTYGAGVDTKRYLGKFIKFRIDLPIENADTHSASHYFYIETSEKLTGDIYLGNLDGPLLEFAQDIIKINELSLRDVEEFVRALQIFYTLSTNNANNDFFSKALIILSVYLYVFDMDLSKSILSSDGFLDSSIKDRIFAVLNINDNIFNGTPYTLIKDEYSYYEDENFNPKFSNYRHYIGFGLINDGRYGEVSRADSASSQGKWFSCVLSKIDGNSLDVFKSFESIQKNIKIMKLI